MHPAPHLTHSLVMSLLAESDSAKEHQLCCCILATSLAPVAGLPARGQAPDPRPAGEAARHLQVRHRGTHGQDWAGPPGQPGSRESHGLPHGDCRQSVRVRQGTGHVLLTCAGVTDRRAAAWGGWRSCLSPHLQHASSVCKHGPNPWWRRRESGVFQAPSSRRAQTVVVDSLTPMVYECRWGWG